MRSSMITSALSLAIAAGTVEHTDGHSPASNWPTFLDFASRCLGGGVKAG